MSILDIPRYVSVDGGGCSGCTGCGLCRACSLCGPSPGALLGVIYSAALAYLVYVKPINDPGA